MFRFACFIFLSFMGLAQAGISCPSSTREILKCVGANRSGDYEMAIKFVKEALICETTVGHAVMIISSTGQMGSSGIIPVQISKNANGDQDYDFSEGSHRYNLSYNPNVSASTFNIIFENGESVYRSLRCR